MTFSVETSRWPKKVVKVMVLIYLHHLLVEFGCKIKDLGYGLIGMSHQSPRKELVNHYSIFTANTPTDAI